jgi:hypothetical protein
MDVGISCIEVYKMKNNHLVSPFVLFFLVIAILLPACSSTPEAPLLAVNLEPIEQFDQLVTQTVTYRSFSLPEGISFELPDSWDFWGNAGYLSPDNGKTLAGIRRTWMDEGMDAERLLYNEDATLLEKSAQNVDGKEVNRYLVEVTLTSASTGEVIMHSYEMIYAIPDEESSIMYGVVFSSPELGGLEDLVPSAEHMIATLHVD